MRGQASRSSRRRRIYDVLIVRSAMLGSVTFLRVVDVT
jgi:hypothetical protein